MKRNRRLRRSVLPESFLARISVLIPCATVMLAGSPGAECVAATGRPSIARMADDRSEVEQLKEKLQRVSHELKLQIAELTEAGAFDKAEGLERELSELQADLVRRIAAASEQELVNGAERRAMELQQQVRELGEHQERIARSRGRNHPLAQAVAAELEARERELIALRGRQPRGEHQGARHEDVRHGEIRHGEIRHGDFRREEIENRLRELHEGIARAIRNRQPDLVVELSHQIAGLLRHDGPGPDSRWNDGPRHDGPRHDGPHPDHPRHDGPHPDQLGLGGPMHDGPRHDGPRHDGPRHDGPRHDGPRHDGPRHDDPRREMVPLDAGWRGEPRGGEPRPWGPGPEWAMGLQEMMSDLRAELKQLRREMDELRRERR